MTEARRAPTLNDIGIALNRANRSVNRDCNYFPPNHVFTHFAMRAAGIGNRSGTTRPDVNARLRNTPLTPRQVSKVFSELRRTVVEAHGPSNHHELPRDLRRWRRGKVGPEVIREAAESIELGIL